MNTHLFPRYHVRPPRGYLNDPNGPVVVDGLLHLYFQYRGSVDLAAPVVWGHVTSRDLVHWRYHRPALAPHPVLGDRDGCWSGNTVTDDDGMVRAFYSGLVDTEPLQRTLVAVSADGGWTFGPPQEVVARPAPEEAISILRDPFVWRHDAGWRMALGAGTVDGTAMVRLYSSADLLDWTYLGPLARMARTRTSAWDSGVMWECPQIVTLDGEPTVLFGSYAPEHGVMNAFSLRVPGGPTGGVDPAELHLLDHGPNFYAPSVLGGTRYGAVVWGWATEGRSLDWCRADGWSGVLTLPRRVSRRSDGSVASAPVGELEELRQDSGRQVGDVLGGLGAQLEIEISAVADGAAGGPSTLSLRCGPCEHLDVVIDADAGRVVVDRDHASTDPRAHGGRVVVDGLDGLRDGEPVRAFLDGSILELFLPGGRVATVRCYPTTPPPWRLELSPPGAARVCVWNLASPA